MSFCAEQIVLLAGNIYSGIGAPSSQSVAYVSGWLTYSGNLGDLNNKLTICTYLTGDSPCLIGMGPKEASIYGLMYTVDYYQKSSLQALAGGGSFWQTMSEGDTRISRASAVEVAKEYRMLHEVAQRDLRLAIQDYKRGAAVPYLVDGSSLYSWPTP